MRSEEQNIPTARALEILGMKRRNFLNKVKKAKVEARSVRKDFHLQSYYSAEDLKKIGAV